MLTHIDLPIENLVLDPNNPRFASDFAVIEPVPDSRLVDSEKDTLARFQMQGAVTDDATTSTADLRRSMMDIGYVPIDRVVVRRIGDTDKYLVIEGNRRVSTVKNLLAALDKKDETHDDLIKIRSHVNSFRVIPCKLINTENKSREEVEHSISVILGIRHHGSLLEWDPLPRAYNIYNEYMGLGESESASFVLDTKKVTEIAARLSVSASKVRSSLQTYIAFLQLSKAVPGVKSRHYSLIEASVSNRSLATFYITQDPLTYELNHLSIERLATLLQFETRDKADYLGKKIVRDPGAVRAFGTLIQRQSLADHTATREYIQSQIEEVLDLSSSITIDEANDNVINHLRRTKWVDTLNKLMADRERRLAIEEFTGVGNDLAALHELQTILVRICRVL
jgi:hypothetical protein